MQVEVLTAQALKLRLARKVMVAPGCDGHVLAVRAHRRDRRVWENPGPLGSSFSSFLKTISVNSLELIHSPTNGSQNAPGPPTRARVLLWAPLPHQLCCVLGPSSAVLLPTGSPGVWGGATYKLAPGHLTFHRQTDPYLAQVCQMSRTHSCPAKTPQLHCHHTPDHSPDTHSGHFPNHTVPSHTLTTP